MNWKRAALTALFYFAGIQTAWSAGFGLYEYGARGNGLGGCMYALRPDPSSIAVNPAQLARLSGTQVDGGVTYITASAKVSYNGEEAEPKRQHWFIPNFYMTHALTERVHLGVMVHSRFGLGNEYDKDWSGARETYKVDLVTASMTPVLSVKVTDRLSLAAGVECMYLDFVSKKIVPTPVGNVDAKVRGDSAGVGVTGGAHLVLTDWLSVGVSGRSEVKQKVKGRATFKRPAPLAAVGAFADTDARSDLTLPAQIGMGIAIEPCDGFRVEASALRVNWSSFNALRIKYDDPVRAPGIPPQTESNAEKNWRDTWRLAIGAEYDWNERLTVRAGFVYDESPIRGDAMDTLIPAHNRNLYNVGFSYKQDDWCVSAAYTYLEARPLSGTTPEGVPMNYKHCEGHMVALNLKYVF